MENNGKIYELIGKAMAEIGAIGKDKKNQQQGFMYRGIDQVYNALQPVMAKYGLFITPEILDHKREERTSTKSWNGETKTTTLLYSIITVRYTVYAPDGSSIPIVVIGEGMDSGDKATNKAMSIAMKYAMFQLFMIPTEAVDPDSECHNVDPKPQPTRSSATNAGTVTKQATLPISQRVEQAISGAQEQPPEPPKPETPAAFIKRNLEEFKTKDPGFDFMSTRAALIKGGVIQDIPSATMTMEQAKDMIEAIKANNKKVS